MITLGKDKTKQEIAEALMKRLGPSMNGASPGYRPDPKSKLVVKPKKDSVYLGIKRTF